jgi:glutaredoxin
MEFAEPYPKGFTIYSKSGCHNCTKIKNLLTEKRLFFLEIDCDDYLIEEKDNFLSFIKNKIGKPYTIFPMVFYDGTFIGGYNEAAENVEKLLLSFEELF